MPEIKQNFTGGKMNKDLDERLVPNGEYRDAMNVQVSTSDSSEVGTVQNLLGNTLISGQDFISADKVCVGSIADEKNNAVYWLLASQNNSVNYSDIVMNSAGSNPLFNSVSNGSSILEYKDNIVTPVVIEADTTIIYLFETQILLGQLGQPNVTAFVPGANQSVSTGSVLTGFATINSSGQTINTFDFSNGADSGGTFFAEPPVIIPSAQGNIPTFQLNYIPDDLQIEIDNNSIIALTFKNSQEENKLPLNFRPDTIITGINIIDNLLFFTDNVNEPKKINIDRCKQGTDGNAPTRLVNETNNITINDNILLQEKHVTVIRKAPSKAPILDLKTGRDLSQVYTGVISVGLDQDPLPNDNDDIISTSSSFNQDPYDFSGVNIGDNVDIQISEDISGSSSFTLANWSVGSTVVLKEFDEVSGGSQDAPPIPITDYRIKGEIVSSSTGFTASIGSPIIIKIEITNIDGFPPVADATYPLRKYAIDLFDTYERLFEFKFPRFATRYKYVDGEYSTYSPFTQVAFVPGTFDYHPKKGYNLGMTNLLTQIDVKNFRLNDTPLDVVEIDILYKEDGSPNIYVVDTIKKDSVDDYWQNNIYNITHETIKSTVPSNQLLRTWDNVPKTALAQEVTGNRIVYGNYTQGFDVFDIQGNPYSPDFKIQKIDQNNVLSWDETQYQTNSVKSIKSLREYQLGVVFIDEYGRETPVISNPSGTFEVNYSEAQKANRLRVGFKSGIPKNQKYYKFYIKQTSGEYYNMAMDRWYNAEDGNVWLSFPSSDRNKIDIDTFLVLKKAQESNQAVDTKSRYKVLAIENEAPDFVKTKTTSLITAKHLNTANNNVFGINTLVDAPVSGVDNFTLNYNFFGNSSGSRLHEVEDGDLYFTVSLTGSSIESQEYRITSITTDAFDPTAPINPKYYIKVDGFLESDVNFITNDASGAFSTEIQDNAKINIFKKKVENLPIFDGKFFVKIYIDDVFRNYISQDTSASENWRTVASKKIYAMRDDHHVTHSIKATGHGEDITPSTAGGRNAYSHPFGRFACYFRRYDYGNTEWDIGIAPSNTSLDVSTSKYRFDSPSNNGTVNVSNPAATPWFYEYWTYTGHGKKINGSNVYASTGTNDTSIDDYLGTNGYNKKADKSARKNEVWFLDMYKHVDRSPSAGNDFAPAYHPSNQANQFNMTSMSTGGIQSLPIGSSASVGNNAAIDYAAGYHHFSLTLGPIFKDESFDTNELYNAGFFGNAGIGAYNILTDGHGANSTNAWINELWSVGIGNPNYNDSLTQTFTDRLSPGSVWRWAEDPFETRYNLNNQVNERNIIRYFVEGNHTSEGDMLREQAGSIPSSANDFDGHFNGAQLSTNFNKQWKWVQEHNTKKLDWIPLDVGGDQSELGPIVNSGREITLTTLNYTGSNDGPFGNDVGVGQTSGDNTISTGIDDHYIYITLDSYNNALDQHGKPCILTTGFIVKSYKPHDLGSQKLLDTSTTNPYLVVRDIDKNVSVIGTGNQAAVKVYLTGYVEALDLGHTIKPDANSSITFVQGTMNGYSPNSAARISLQKSTTGKGAFTTNANYGVAGATTKLLYAVGYTMEFVEPSYDNELLPDNPAIWETEPKDSPDLDIYYEASDLIPVRLNEETDAGFLPLQTEEIGSTPILNGTFENCTIFTASSVQNFSIDAEIIDMKGNILTLSTPPTIINTPAVTGIDWVHIKKPDGSIFSTYVEAIDGSFLTINLNTWNFWHTLNYYNCYTFFNGVESNRVRDNFNLPFISNGVRASSTLEEVIEKQTRQYGLIFSGIYNSISSINNLNQFIAAENITKEINPVYGSIQKLHSRSTADGDLITLCEDRILKILATKDALFNADGNPQLIANEQVLGQAIPYAGEYGISQNPESFASESYRAYFTDKQRGSVIRLSMDGLTPISDHGMKDWFRDNLKLNNKLIGSYDHKKDEYNIALKPNTAGQGNYVVSFKEDVKGWVSFKSFVQMESGVSMASDYYTFSRGKIYQHHFENTTYNTYYGLQSPSTISFLLNNSPSIVKSFKTLLYEGSQAKVTKDLSDGQYYNLTPKKGWYLQTINTDMQAGSNVEFIKKENKWFNYIKGVETDIIEEKDFTYQGIGVVDATQLIINTTQS